MAAEYLLRENLASTWLRQSLTSSSMSTYFESPLYDDILLQE